MIVGIPKEIKDSEYRVAATPEGVAELVAAGHRVVVEGTAGEGSALPDAQFAAAGAAIAPDADAVFAQADMIVKVKEPQPREYQRFRPGQLLFTYLHLAADEALTRFLVEREVAAVAYETVQTPDGRLPLLAPMSEIAGRLSVQAGARYLEKAVGGRGVLLGGVAGVAPGNVLVIGAGIVGINAAMVAIGMQAHVSVLDTNLDRLRELELVLGGRVELLYSTQLAIEELLPTADLVVGAVLLPGARAPRLVSRAALGLMRPGSVVVDVAVDQGGCFETTRPTTHSDPVYVVDGVIHYCVANMPGAVPVTSTRALGNATLPHVTWLADMGVNGAIDAHPGLEPGVNVRAGRVVNPTVAEALRT